MNNTSAIIKGAVEKSPLSYEEKKECAALFAEMPSAVLNDLADFLTDDTCAVERIYKNFCDKKRALQTHDTVAWDSIMRDEITMLEDVASSEHI